MREIFKLKTFWIVAILSAAIIFTAILNFDREYITETDVLIISKSVAAASSADQIVDNFVIISQSLSFYKRLIADDPSLEIGSISKVEIERAGKSGVIKITAKNKNSHDSYILSQGIAKGIISSAGLFYNIKNDIDIRIIDGPETRSSDRVLLIISILESFLAGFVLAFLSFSLSFFLFKDHKIKERIAPSFVSWLPKKTEKFEKQAPATFQEEVWTPEKKVEIEKIKPFYTPDKKAAAPDNLPIAEDFPIEKSEEILVEKTQDMAPITKEATPEEVKERLNKLLSGQF